MKHIGVSAFIILMASLHLGFSQEASVTGNQMVVYGTGSVTTPGDRAVINFSVKGFGPTLEAAVSVTRKKMSDIASQLFSLGLKESDLHTSSFNSGDNFEGKAFLSSSRDYRAAMSAYVFVDSLPLLEKVAVAISNGPIETLSNITFALKGDSTNKMEARRRAVENAQMKATVMADQLGIKLGRVLNVEELLSSSDGDFYLPERERDLYLRGGRAMTTSAMVLESTTPSFYGQTFSVKSGVKITFEIVNRLGANGK